MTVASNLGTLQSAFGCCEKMPYSRLETETGIGASESVLCVTRGGGGHSTGWLGTRLAVRAVVDRLSPASAERRYAYAADDFPQSWGGMGGMLSHEYAEQVYRACLTDFGTPGEAVPDLRDLLLEISRVILNISTHAPIRSVIACCVAVRLEGRTILGAHAGGARALLLREGAVGFKELAAPHVVTVTPPDSEPKIEVVNNALGLDRVFVDTFSAELHERDLLLLGSERLNIADAELVRLLQVSLKRDPSLESAVRTIEERAAELAEANKLRARDVAFALARLAPRTR